MADAMREEYRAITEAGMVLQIDDPQLPVQWDLMIGEGASLAEYERFCHQRVEALNHALAGVPEDMVRYHICCGSHHGPHSTDVPFRDILPIIFKVRASGIVFEAGNVRHEHEWQIWQDIKLPDGESSDPWSCQSCYEYSRASRVGGAPDQAIRGSCWTRKHNRGNGLRYGLSRRSANRMGKAQKSR